LATDENRAKEFSQQANPSRPASITIENGEASDLRHDLHHQLPFKKVFISLVNDGCNTGVRRGANPERQKMVAYRRSFSRGFPFVLICVFSEKIGSRRTEFIPFFGAVERNKFRSTTLNYKKNPGEA
jgi:hypothetical protein